MQAVHKWSRKQQRGSADSDAGDLRGKGVLIKNVLDYFGAQHAICHVRSHGQGAGIRHHELPISTSR
jgi:hypothetical protein